MKMGKRIVSLLLALVMVAGCVPALSASAATSLPDSIYLTQTGKSTCTLCSCAMMLRARFYLSGSSDWSMITEKGIRSTAWIEGTGLRHKFTYSINGNSATVRYASTSGITASALKELLDEHPEGIVLYCGKLPHAVFLTDYEGDTFYCADTLPDNSGERIPLADSYNGKKYGGQAAVLKKVTAYWYVSSYSIDGTENTAPSCTCSESYAGSYICATSSSNLLIRSGHGTNYGYIGSIPKGATVTVTKASGSGDSDWAHVEYNGISGYASMKFLKKADETVTEGTPVLQCWLSDEDMGDAYEGFPVGSRYYLCAGIYNSVTGAAWGSGNVSVSFYDPNGELVVEKDAGADTVSILGYFSLPGEYTAKVTASGDAALSETYTFTVEENPMVLHSSTDAVELTLGHEESTVVYIWTTGYHQNSLILSKSDSNTNATSVWGEWSGDELIPIAINANTEGDTVVTFQIKDEYTEEVLDSIDVNVTVRYKTFGVSYDANGGENAPTAQTKREGVDLTLSADVPVRDGYTFLGWSGDPDAAAAEYAPGDSFATDANTTLYAIWKAKEYTVSYDANGGEGAPEGQVKVHDTDLILRSDVPVREDCVFLGWATRPDAKEPEYTGGDVFTVNGDTTLYAVWHRNAYITVGSTTCRAGDTVTVDILMRNDPGFTELELLLGYDAENLTLVAAKTDDPGLVLTMGQTLKLTGEWSGGSVLCTLTFQVSDNAPEEDYSLPVEVVRAVNSEGEDLTFICTAGDLRVSPRLMGDVNADGWVDAEDAALIMQYEVGLIGDDGLDAGVADVNGDGWCDAEDAALIMQLEVGLIDGF